MKQTSAFSKRHKTILQNNAYTLQEPLLKVNRTVTIHEGEGFCIVYGHFELLPFLFSLLRKMYQNKGFL